MEISSLQAQVSDLAHAYCDTPAELGNFNMHIEHILALKSLSYNQLILIAKPDKGSGVAILNKSDYIKTMGSILDDRTKFWNIGCVDLNGNTAKNEQKLQKHKDLANRNILAHDVYDRFRPTATANLWLAQDE